MAMSKEEKNARARARYAEKKALSGDTGRGVRMKFDPYRFPTPKHGARYGGEGNQVGMIGPPRKYKKRKAKASAPIIVKAKAVPAPVKRAAKRIRHKTRPLSAVTKPLLGLGKPRKPRAKKM